jgi:hypothetical protein
VRIEWDASDKDVAVLIAALIAVFAFGLVIGHYWKW